MWRAFHVAERASEAETRSGRTPISTRYLFTIRTTSSARLSRGVPQRAPATQVLPARASPFAAPPLEIESYELDQLERPVSSDFTRVTTVVRLRGRGEEGLGEDVTYEAEHHKAQQRTEPLPIAGTHTLDGFSNLVGDLDLFPSGLDREVYRLYRRWAYESAALDLALRQAGLSLADAIGRA